MNYDVLNQEDRDPTADGNNTLSSVGSVPQLDVTLAPSAGLVSIQNNDVTIDENNVQLYGTPPETKARIPPEENQANKYKLHSEIARGGMGVVLEAEDNTLRRDVAMKVLINPADASRQRVLRFIEEACITSQLQHPGIMPIYELGTDENGNVFYTMKRVTGRTLKDILNDLKNGRKETEAEFPLNRLVNILQRVCDALAYAHSKGVIHRDLKPDNIMIGDYGEVLVLDWGLAKVLKRRTGSSFEDNKFITGIKTSTGFDETRRPDDSEIDEICNPLATIEGNAIGTPGYMAPEQARGQVARMDEKSDIYSLGAILYHILYDRV